MINNGTNPYFVIEMETGHVVISDHQQFGGYTLFLLKDHITELHFIPGKKRLKHLEEMGIVYEAVYNVFKPDKMNAELLGNGEPHIHWHIIPRYKDDPIRKWPIWILPRKILVNDENKPSPIELSEMVYKLKNEILILNA
jgi:diadenosine tetraphosphate (Ap4A) HIT family hydrolase